MENASHGTETYLGSKKIIKGIHVSSVLVTYKNQAANLQRDRMAELHLIK